MKKQQEKQTYSIGPYSPSKKPLLGIDCKGNTALFSNENSYQLAQLDDVSTGKGYGWWKFPNGTFKECS
jgi:hypothetical protein